MKRFFLLVAVVLSFCVASTAMAAAKKPAAPKGADSGLSTAEKTLKKLGYEYSTENLEEGMSYHRFQMDGYNVKLYEMECESGTCKGLQMFAGFEIDEGSLSFEDVNRWNADHRYARLYLMKDGGVAFESDYSLDWNDNPKAVALWIKDYSSMLRVVVKRIWD